MPDDMGTAADKLERALAALRASETEQRRLLADERRASGRLALLARAGEALSAPEDVGEVLTAFARLMVPEFADWSAVYVLKGDDLQLVAVHHHDADRVALALQAVRRRRPKLGDEKGIGAVLAAGKTQWLPEIEEAKIRAALDDSVLVDLLIRLGLKSSLSVPILAGRERLGVACFVTAESGRSYDEADRDFAEEVARRVSVAIDRSRLWVAARDAARRAEEANRMKDEFLATVSHELRTPLNTISGWAELLSQKQDDPAAVAKGIEIIRRNAQAQGRLIDDILDVSRIISGRLKIDSKPVDLVAIANEALEVIRPSAAAKQIVLTLGASQSSCLLIGDAQRLQQVVWNLLSNAVKFTGPGGRIAAAVEQEGPTVVFAVTDTGKGIEEAFLPHLFERFQQGDRSTTRTFGGLGLGLAIVRHIVELHGGRVSADSAGAGKGATFRIFLPVRAVAPVPSPGESRAAPRSTELGPASGEIGGLRILVVDDEPDAREMLQEVLAARGGLVETAASAREGLEVLARFRPDVIVSDIGMPGEDGYAFIRRVRAGPPEGGASTPAIALTAYVRPEDRRRALEAGFNTHVAKPVDIRKLGSVIAGLRAAVAKDPTGSSTG